MLRESRRFARAASASLHVANWVVLGHGTNVTRVTRGENIFNNKIYIGDLASIRDVRRPAAKYRGEYQEVPATTRGATKHLPIKVLRYLPVCTFTVRITVGYLP